MDNLRHLLQAVPIMEAEVQETRWDQKIPTNWQEKSQSQIPNRFYQLPVLEVGLQLPGRVGDGVSEVTERLDPRYVFPFRAFHHEVGRFCQQNEAVLL